MQFIEELKVRTREYLEQSQAEKREAEERAELAQQEIDRALNVLAALGDEAPEKIYEQPELVTDPPVAAPKRGPGRPRKQVAA